MSRKITLVGAGSVVFAKTLIGDILQYPELADSRICLMDIDPARLKTAGVLMRRMVEQLGVPASIETTCDQRLAVKDANYVICTVQVGGFKPSTLRDFEIPKRYGLRQTIADTLGVGGIFRALRTIPVINGIARDIADHGAPGCLLLNYTNPMAMNCWAVAEATGIPHVGLCHSVFGTARMLASHVNLPIGDVEYLVAGINHMAFFLKFQYRGQDAYPLLFKVLEDPRRNFELVRYEMMRRTGYFVTESSEHQSEYVPYFIRHGAQMVGKFNIPLDEYIRRCETIMATWKETEKKLLGSEGSIEIAPQSLEYGSHIIHAMESGKPRTVYGNVPNTGLIENLTPGCCVEVPCLADATGLHPVRIGRLPEQLAALCMSNINVQRLVVSAALSGRREHIYHAAMLDPHTAASLPLDKIWALCDDLIEAHQKDGYLGEFQPVIRNTGRSLRGTGDRVIARLTAGRISPKTGRFELSLRVENPSPQARVVRLALHADSDRINVPRRSLTFRLKKSTAIERKIPARLLRPLEKPERVDLSTDDPDVLAIGVVLHPRNILTRNEDGSACFALELAGFPAAEGTLTRCRGGLRVRITVHDSDPRPNLKLPLRGSSVELFFAVEGTAGFRQFVMVPHPRNGGSVRAVCFGRTAATAAKANFRRTKSHYTAETVLPLKNLAIPRAGPFLFHAVCHLNALGDAHSGGRCGLQGVVETRGDTLCFSEADPV